MNVTSIRDARTGLRSTRRFVITTLRKLFCHLQGHPTAVLKFEPRRLTWRCEDCKVTGPGWAIADRRKAVR